MSSDETSNITRRGILASVSGLAAIAVAERASVFAHAADVEPADKTSGTRQDLSKVEQEYERLLPLWQEERKQFRNSNITYNYWRGPHGKAIIALGPAIIPRLIKEVRSGDFWFNVPLALITKVDIANGAGISEQENSKLWLKWWESSKE